MSASKEVATRAARQVSPVGQVCHTIEQMRPHFEQALPEDVSVDRFTRVVLTAVQQNPDLIRIEDKQSLYNGCVRAAQDGLLPDGREGALVVLGAKVQWMPMVNGLIKRAAKAGIKIDANTVCENDTFVYELGDNPSIEHKLPRLGQPRGKVVGVYAIATLTDGTKMREIMDLDDVEKIRNSSRTKNAGPWKDWWDQMALKSAIRRLFKKLPLWSADTRLQSALEADHDLYDFGRTVADDPPAPAKPAARKRRPAGLQAVVDQSPPIDVDPDTGEVIPPAADGSDIFDDE